MNPPKCDDLDYIHFLIAAQKVCTGTEAARCAPEGAHPPAHDAFTRLLQRQPPDGAVAGSPGFRGSAAGAAGAGRHHLG
jgi:putative transposase